MLQIGPGFHRRLKVNLNGMARGDVDLWLILTDPIEARNYIKAFDWNCPPEYRPDKIILDSGRTVNFNTMTDEEAVVAATAILRDVEVPMVMLEKDLQNWEQ